MRFPNPRHRWMLAGMPLVPTLAPPHSALQYFSKSIRFPPIQEWYYSLQYNVQLFLGTQVDHSVLSLLTSVWVSLADLARSEQISKSYIKCFLPKKYAMRKCSCECAVIINHAPDIGFEQVGCRNLVHGQPGPIVDQLLGLVVQLPTSSLVGLDIGLFHQLLRRLLYARIRRIVLTVVLVVGGPLSNWRVSQSCGSG